MKNICLFSCKSAKNLVPLQAEIAMLLTLGNSSKLDCSRLIAVLRSETENAMKKRYRTREN